MNIIVTGASNGIGYEVVKILSKHKGNHIVALSRNWKKVSDLAAECNKLTPDAHVTPYEFDLTQFDFYPLIIQRLGTIIPRCDILINNAGKLFNKPFEKFSPDEFDAIFDVNVKSPFLFIQALLPMMNKGGHIVNIGSMGGIQGSKKFPGLSAYSASKGALTILTEILAEELVSREIRVNCLALGSVGTDMFANAFPEGKAQINSAQMAQFIADFAVQGHRYFNGKVLPVSAGVP